MHWAAVHAHHKARGANEPDQLEERSLVGQLDTIFGGLDLVLRLPDNDYAGGQKSAAEFFNHSIRERFASTAGKRVKKDEGRVVIETRKRVARWNWAAKRRADGRARALGQLYITFDRVRATIDLGDAIVKAARALARIAHSINFSRPADFCNQRTTQESLEIEREIGLQQFSCPQPPKQIPCRTEPAKFATGENVNVIDIRITAEEWREFRVDHPRDLSIGMRVAQQCYCWKGVDDVAERTRFDD